MANNRQQFTLQFNADTSQAKKQIEQLTNNLVKISTLNLKVAVEDSGLNKASVAAQQLQKSLQQAINVDTGKLDLSIFQKSLQDANTSVMQLTQGLLEAGSMGASAFMQLSTVISNAEVPLKKINNTLASWGQTLKNTVKWEISSSIVHNLESTLSGAVSYIKNLNSSLTDIRIVTGQSTEDMARFAQQANRAARELSTTTKAYADASLIFYQQGDNDEQVKKKTEITIKAANASFGSSAEEMSEYLTAVWNSYQAGADELEKYVDIMASLGAETATSLEEIATAMQKVAATANTVGVSMEQMSSIIATVSSVTREAPESIGTSFKTILARMGDLKLGETLDDGVSLGTVSSTLDNIGVKLLDTNGEMRDMGDIIEDLGDKWQTMGQAQKTAVAQVVAGKRQYTQLMALFENWDMYQSNLTISENSDGSLQKMADVYAESWNAAANQVTAAIEKIYSSLLDDQVIISILNILEKVIQAVNGVIDGFGGLGGIIATVGSTLGNYFNEDIAQGLVNTVTNLKNYFQGVNQQQQEYLRLQMQYKSELDALYQDNAFLSTAQNQEYEYLSNIAQANIDLAQRAKTLTKEQISEVQSLTSAYEKQMQELIKLQTVQEQRSQAAKAEAEQLKQEVLHEEANWVANKTGQEYDKLDIQSKKKMQQSAQRSIITDSIFDEIEIVIEPEFNGKQAKTEAVKTVNDLNKIFKDMKWPEPKMDTFDQLLQSTEKWTTALGQAKTALGQLQALYGETGESLFSSNKTSDELLGDLQNYITVYNQQVEMMGRQPAMIDGQDANQLVSSLIGDPSVTQDQIRSIFSGIQSLFSTFVSDTSIQASALQSVLLEIVPPQLKERFKQLFQEWQQIGTQSLSNLDNAAKQFSQTFKNNVANALKENSQSLQSLIKVASGLTSIVAIFNTVSTAWETLKNPDASGWEKFSAVISGVSAILINIKNVMDAGKVIQAAYNALVAIGVGLQLADAAATERSAAAHDRRGDELREENIQQAINNGMSSVKKLKAAFSGLKSIISTVASAIGTFFAGISTATLVTVGIVAGAVVAVTAVGAAIYYVATAEERYKKALDERAKAVIEASEKNQENISQLTDDTSSLDAIMKDSNLTYDEQISKINEIAKAYGIQTDAVDALSGSYARFSDSIKKISQNEAKKNAEEATENAQEMQAIVDAYLNMEREIEVRIPTYEEYKSAGDLSLGEIYFATAEDYYWSKGFYGVQDTEALQKIVANNGLFSDLNDDYSMSGGRNTLIRSTAWTENGWKKDNGNLLGLDALVSESKLSYEDYANAEGEVWTNEEFQAWLKKYGFQFNNDSFKLTEIFGATIDYEGLLAFLKNSQELSGYIGQGTYTDSVIKVLEGAHLAELYSAKQVEEQANAVAKLWETDDFLANVYTTNQNKIDQKNTKKLIDSVTADNKMTTKMAVADTLSNYGAYEDSATLLNTVYQLSENAVNKKTLSVNVDPEEVKQNVVDTLLTEFKDLDVTTALKLNISDITVESDGTVSIDQAVKDYVETAVEVNKQQNLQNEIDTNKSFLTQDSFSEEDYQTLQQLQANESLWEGFDAESFARLDATSRKLMIEQQRAQSNNAEIEGLKALSEYADNRAKSYYTKAETWTDNFNASHDETYADIQTRIAADTAMRDELQNNIEQAESGTEIKWSELGYKNIDAARLALEEYDTNIAIDTALIQEGIDLWASYSTAASDAQLAQRDLDSSEYTSWADKVNTATEAAEAFSASIKGQSSVTKQNLAIMQVYDNEAISNFNNLSSTEWAKYSYETAVKYYDDLAQLYDEDSIEYAMIQQEKKQMAQELSETLLSQSEATLATIQGKTEETVKKAEELANKAQIFQKAIETGELTEEQKLLFNDTELNQWNAAQNTTQRASVAANIQSQAAIIQQEAQKDLVNLYTDASKELVLGEIGIKSLTGGGDLFGDAGQDNFKVLLTQYERMNWFDPGEAAAWSAAYSSALSKGLLEGKTSNREVIEAVRQELLDMANDASEEGEKAAAIATDTIKTIFASVASENQSAAESAVDAWESAFTQIASLRKKILSGEDITEDIFGGDLDNLWQQFQNSGYTDYATFSKDVKEGKYNPELPEFNLEDYLVSTGVDQFDEIQGDSKKFVFRNDMLKQYEKEYAKQNPEDTNVDNAKAYAEEQVREDITTALTKYNDTNGAGFNVDEAVAAYMAGDWNQKFKAADGTMVNASQLFNMAANTVSDAVELMNADIEEYQKRQEALSAANRAVTDAKAEKMTVGTGEGNYEELTELDAALERAQAEGAKEDGNWENLSADDRDLLASYGITSFDEVDSAAIECASALSVLEGAALNAVKTLLNKNYGYTQNEKGEWGTTDEQDVFQVDEKINTLLGELDEAISAADNHIIDVTDRTNNYEAQSYGFADNNEWKEYAQYLYEINGGQGKLIEQSEELQEEYSKLAAIANKTSKAWGDLTESQDDNISTLKTGVKGSNDYRKALKSLGETIKSIFGDAEEVTDDFVESHLDDIEKMADGDEEAAERVEKALLDDMLGSLSNQTVEIDIDTDGVADELTTLGELLNNFGDEYSDQDIGFEITADDSPAIAALNNILTSTNMTAEQMQAALNAVGWEPEIEYAMVPLAQHEAGNTTAYVRDNAGNVVTVTAQQATDTENYVYVPMIKGAKKTGGGASSLKKPTSSGGGGGGGGEAKKLDKKDPNDEKKRYFQVDNALDTLTDALTKVDKLKERAFGEGHLKNLESEISLLQQEVGIQEDYIEQAKSWLAVDRNAVLELGATFDGEGNISNYDEMMNSIIAKYNAFIDKYNAASASKQEDMADEKEEMDEWYEDAIDAIDQYQETLALIREKENDILETQNKISERALEAIQYKVEYKVEINEAENDYLEYLNDKYEDVLDSQDLLMDNYIRQGELAQDNLNNLGVAYKELEAAYAAGTLTQADYVEGLQDIQDQTLENLKTIQDVKEELEELYEDTLDLADEQITKHTDKIDSAAEAMESYISIMGLLGKKTNYDQILTFYQKQYEYNLASLESQVSYLNVLKEEEQYYLDRMNSAEGLTETERAQYEALEETLMEVNNNVLSKTQETLEALQTMYNTTIEGIMKKLEESIVGIDNDIAWVMEQYGYYTEEVEQYVSASRELYEINKLNRNINQSINDTTSSVHKKRLKELQDEINAKSEANQLSEYDLNMMDLKYQLLLKQIALEEAQNAKSTVRLTRDSEGNMIYAYTADQNAVNQAQQEYEDVLQQMSDANYSALTDIQQTTLQLQQETLQSIQEIAEDETLTQEQKNQRIGEIIEHYYTRLEQLSQQYSNVSQNTMETDLLIAEHYNTSVSSLASTTQNEVTSLVKDMLTNTQGQKEAMNQTYADIIEAMGQYEEQVDQVTNTTDLSFDTMTDSISSYNSVVQDAQTETNKLTQELQTELTQINKTTDAWDNYYDTLGDVIKQYENLYESIQKTIKAQSSVVTQVASSSVNVSTGATTVSSNSKTSSDSGSSSNSSGSGNDNSNSNSSNTPGTKSTPTVKSVKLTYVARGNGAQGVTPSGPSTLTVGNSGNIVFNTPNDCTASATSANSCISISGSKITALSEGEASVVVMYTKMSNGISRVAFATGGLADYTGPAWVDGTKSKPELVLNADDTQNMLQIVSEVRQLDKSTLSMVDDLINLATISMYSNLASVHAGSIANTSNTSEIEQNVHITAEFPNVQNSNEIQDAFDNLVNRAAQYVGSLKR